MAGSIRATGGTIAIAIYGSIVSNEVGRNLGPKVAAAAVAAGLPPPAASTFIGKLFSRLECKNMGCLILMELGALTSGSAMDLMNVEGISPAIIVAGTGALKSVYSNAFKYVYLISIAFGCKLYNHLPSQNSLFIHTGTAILASVCIKDVDGLLAGYAYQFVYENFELIY